MSDEALVRFRIPSEFVVRNGLPTGAELAYGYQHGWLLADDVVAIALQKYEADLPLRDAEEALALLLSDDFDQVADLVDELKYGDQPQEERARYWLFQALAWLHSHPEIAEDPLETIEMLYADFGHPAEIQGLVRYMPPPPGALMGLDAIRQRWGMYVDGKGSEYRERQADL